MNALIDVVRPAEVAAGVHRDAVLAGRVVSTAGSQIIVLLADGLDDQAGLQMGSLVSVRSSHATIYGIISGLSTPMPRPPDEGPELKIAEIVLLGEVADSAVGGNGRFRRGVSRLPSLDARVYLADQDETAIVYALPGRQTVSIGSVHQDPCVPACISVDDLLGKHFALLGTTGTGKSCALTLLLKRILEQNPNGHVLLLDPHGEYARAFGSRAELLTGESFRLPYWVLNFEELTEVLFGNDKDDMFAECSHLRELVLAAKQKFAGNANRITVDTPVPYSLRDALSQNDAAIGSLDNHHNLPTYLRVKSILASMQTDRRFAFMFDSGIRVTDNLAALLGRLFRVPAAGKPLAILDLASIPSEALNIVVAVICRLAFEFAVWSEQRQPLLPAGLRGSAPICPAGQRKRIRTDQAGVVADR
jgi:DNA helicase HerA-like ATPase